MAGRTENSAPSACCFLYAFGEGVVPVCTDMHNTPSCAGKLRQSTKNPNQQKYYKASFTNGNCREEGIVQVLIVCLFCC